MDKTTQVVKDCYRHGDVALEPAALWEVDGAEKSGEDLNSTILAEGEVTGHRHEIVSGTTKLIRFDGKTYLKVISEVAEINHPEHGLREIARRPLYRVKIQKQQTPRGWEKVSD